MGGMYAALTEAQGLLNGGWQYNLGDEHLEFIHELLLSGLNYNTCRHVCQS